MSFSLCLHLSRAFSAAQVILHAFHYGFILLVAASGAEAAELLQQLKASENRASDSLQPALDDRHAPRCAGWLG